MIIYALNALAAVDYQAARADINARQIGLWGISQAGWIIPVAASIAQGSVAFTIIVSGPTVSIGEENLYSDLTGDHQGRATGMAREEITQRLKAQGPVGFDHYALIEEMRMPGLWLYGALDQSIPVAESVADLEAIKGQWGRDFTWQVFPGANHGLKVARTGGSWERPRPTQTVAGYFDVMDAWLFEHVGVQVR
jgi:pimeloyl-ACP methyl ester carboxylesterase